MIALAIFSVALAILMLIKGFRSFVGYSILTIACLFGILVVVGMIVEPQPSPVAVTTDEDLPPPMTELERARIDEVLRGEKPALVPFPTLGELDYSCGVNHVEVCNGVPLYLDIEIAKDKWKGATDEERKTCSDEHSPRNLASCLSNEASRRTARNLGVIRPD
jgi:hypothetical protein